MTFGYLIFVSKSDSCDYLKLAYALALSIKNTQREGYDKVALVIDDVKQIDDLKSPWVFDKIIEWDNETFWNGRSWMDQLSPWDYTVCLDADMLFFRDCSHWIDHLINTTDLYVTNKSYTYRGELVTNNYYRKAFVENELPNLYSFFTFFKKESEKVNDFFTLGRYIIKHPNEFKNNFLQKYRPRIVGTDEALALSAKILDIDVTYNLDFPKIVHLKPMIQNWPWPADLVSDHVGFYFNTKGKLKIGNFQQMDIVHYVEKQLVTDEVVSILEQIAWKK